MGKRLSMKGKYWKKDRKNDKKKAKSQQNTHGDDFLTIICYYFKKECVSLFAEKHGWEEG